MRCRVCSEDKLSEEFIPYDMTSSCKHPRLMCLRCATKAASTSGKCPYKDCGQPAPVDSDQVLEFKAMLDCLFAEIYPLSDDLPPPVNEEGTHPIINIVMLTGERHVFRFDPTYTVLHLKKMIFQELKISVEKQKLLYEEQELEEYLENGTEAKLLDYAVKPNSSIFLMILLYAIPPNLNHVTFDLFWGYPSRGRDYLDASCLIFRGTQHIATVDYNHQHYVGAIRHSGDVMDHSNRKGHHTMEVYLQQIPSNVTHLFFTLSAWNSPNISYFPNPSLRFYETSRPQNDLCTTTFSHARHSQAVIMCSVSRHGNQWQIYNSGKLSAGNAKRYDPLIDTIRSLIQSGV